MRYVKKKKNTIWALLFLSKKKLLRAGAPGDCFRKQLIKLKKKKLKTIDNLFLRSAVIFKEIFLWFEILVFKFIYLPILIPLIIHMINYFFFYFVLIFFFYEESDLLRVWVNWEIYIASFYYFLQFIVS